MLDLLNFESFFFFLSKSLKELNVSVSAFPGAFRRQLDLKEIDQNFYNVVLGTNFMLIRMLTLKDIPWRSNSLHRATRITPYYVICINVHLEITATGLF